MKLKPGKLYEITDKIRFTVENYPSQKEFVSFMLEKGTILFCAYIRQDVGKLHAHFKETVFLYENKLIVIQKRMIEKRAEEFFKRVL